MKPLILGINGSPNKNGRVGKMLETVLKQSVKLGARVETINLADYKIFPHTGALDSKNYLEKTEDGMGELQKLVLEADAIVWATPTHWFGQTSLMKVFMDRLTSLEHFDFLLEGKATGIITYGPQGGALNNAMNLMMILNQWGMVIPPYGTLFNEGREDKWFADDLKLLAKNIMLCVKNKSKYNWGYPGNKYKSSPIELLK